MSVTPIRNRLLLTPTRNNLNKIYNPIDDLKLLGQLFNIDKKKTETTKIISPPKISPPKISPLKVSPPKIVSPKVITNIPSFVNKDVSKFARNYSSSFNDKLSSDIDIESSEISMVIDDTLPITQSQSQSQQIPEYNEPEPEYEEEEIDTTFEKTVNTSNLALPEAIIRDRSGIYGVSDEEEDEDEDEEEDIPSEISDYEMDIDIDPVPIPSIDNSFTIQPIKPSSKPPQFTNSTIKKLFTSLQIKENNIPLELFNELTNKFIDMEIMESIETSENLGFGNRLMIDTDNIDNIFLEAINECDLEIVRDLESLLYSNKSIRRSKSKVNKPINKELSISIGIEADSDSDESIDYRIPLEEEESDVSVY